MKKRYAVIYPVSKPKLLKFARLFTSVVSFLLEHLLPSLMFAGLGITRFLLFLIIFYWLLLQVLLITTCGEIDIELWSKEAPKACRNFIQLCLEGYYDGTIFHRIVKGMSLQAKTQWMFSPAYQQKNREKENNEMQTKRTIY